jgi:hypothetical protein
MDVVGLIAIFFSIKFAFIMFHVLKTEMRVRRMKRKYNDKGKD